MLARYLSGAVVALAALVCFTPSASGALSSGAVISVRGVGPVRLGMSVAQAQARIGHDLSYTSFNEPCGNVVLSRRLRTYGLTTRHRIWRIDTTSSRLRTSRGVRVGDSVSFLLSRYPGRLHTGREFYTRLPTYTYVAGRRSIVFGTDGSRINLISVGRKPEIDYVEGCA